MNRHYTVNSPGELKSLLGRLDSLTSQLDSLKDESARDRRQFDSIKRRLKSYSSTNSRLQRCSRYISLENTLQRLEYRLSSLKREFSTEHRHLNQVREMLLWHTRECGRLTDTLHRLERDKKVLYQDTLSLVSVTSGAAGENPLSRETTVFQAVNGIKHNTLAKYLGRISRRVSRPAPAVLCLEFKPAEVIPAPIRFEPPTRSPALEYRPQQLPVPAAGQPDAPARPRALEYRTEAPEEKLHGLAHPPIFEPGRESIPAYFQPRPVARSSPPETVFIQSPRWDCAPQAARRGDTLPCSVPTRRRAAVLCHDYLPRPGALEPCAPAPARSPDRLQIETGSISSFASLGENERLLIPYTEEERRLLAYRPRPPLEQIQAGIADAMRDIANDWLVPLGDAAARRGIRWSQQTLRTVSDKARWLARNPRYLALLFAMITWILEPSVIAHTTIPVPVEPPPRELSPFRGTVAGTLTRHVPPPSPAPVPPGPIQTAPMQGPGIQYSIAAFTWVDRACGISRSVARTCSRGYGLLYAYGRDLEQHLTASNPPATYGELIADGAVRAVPAAADSAPITGKRAIYIIGFKNPRNTIFRKSVKVTHDGHLVFINGLPHVIHWAPPAGKWQPEELIEPLDKLLAERNFALTAVAKISVSEEQYTLYQQEVTRILSNRPMPSRLARNLRKNLCHRYTYGLVSKRFNPRFKSKTIWIPQCDAPVAFKRWNDGWGSRNPKFNAASLILNPFRKHPTGGKHPTAEQIEQALQAVQTFQEYAVTPLEKAGTSL